MNKQLQAFFELNVKQARKWLQMHQNDDLQVAWGCMLVGLLLLGVGSLVPEVSPTSMMLSFIVQLLHQETSRMVLALGLMGLGGWVFLHHGRRDSVLLTASELNRINLLALQVLRTKR